MENIRFAGFSYEGLNNLGDHIQSICMERLIPLVKKRFNRDKLGQILDPAKYVVVMNGWFTHSPQYFPPSDTVFPFFWGFHVTNSCWDKMSTPNCINYLRTHSPIGCRDSFTQKCLGEIGVDSFYSKCLSLTLPKRKKRPTNGWNILVDVPIPLPAFIEDNAIHVSHRISPNVPEKDKFEQAQKLLALYRDSANLIVTTRLHCALPAAAMGIPVIFLGDPNDYRLSLLSDIGVKINSYPNDFNTEKETFINDIKRLWSEVDWKVEPVNFEAEKKSLITEFEERLNARIGILNQYYPTKIIV
ncbi:polysaccharide pyruvyl transferase family protein [Chitinophaga eiseniae]|uniref:Polysaccharide pyruvyl transferase family protein n=1 Tax=Chitinophaga eiseniae TaxID=634771 RepID=A0A847SE37_9BACT|nr:polysaccharide pyruvyl transferase family protein [Chitinophaga eiseniae]NLR81450.1 polysaccharide pyruvyl transferase family protein [Chitinophaga eiseniae]